MTGSVGAGGTGTVVGQVLEVWRYPVKSMGGESLVRADCERRGLRGDRVWAVVGEDGRIGSGKTTRRFRRMPGLLGSTCQTDGRGEVWVVFPDGRRARVDDPESARWASEATGESVHFAREGDVSYFDDGPLHVLTSSDLAGLRASGNGGAWTDRRRYRPNLLVDMEDALIAGSRYRVGESTVLTIAGPTERCVMPTLAQPGLPFAPGILKHLEGHHEGRFGVYATVERPGGIAVGDPVTLLA